MFLSCIREWTNWRLENKWRLYPLLGWLSYFRSHAQMLSKRGMASWLTAEIWRTPGLDFWSMATYQQIISARNLVDFWKVGQKPRPQNPSSKRADVPAVSSLGIILGTVQKKNARWWQLPLKSITLPTWRTKLPTQMSKLSCLGMNVWSMTIPISHLSLSCHCHIHAW